MKEKTNAIRKIESKKVAYRLLDYSDTPYVSASEVAAYLDVSPDALFKTLVVQGKKDHYVFLIPASSELDLKKAAKATGEKKIALLPSRELYPLTGYVHGGCSPIGMKKAFPTFVDSSARNLPRICFSGGKIGYSVEILTEDLTKLIAFAFADVRQEKGTETNDD